MIAIRRPAAYIVPILALFFLALGCHSQIAPTPPQAGPTLNAEAVAAQLRTIAAAGTLADLTFPNFPDYSQQVQALYQSVNYAPVWMRDGQAIPQALAMITAFQSSRQKGLNPEDYDASRWPQRLAVLKNSSVRRKHSCSFRCGAHRERDALHLRPAYGARESKALQTWL